MIYSASPLIKMLFLFSFSFTTLLILSGLTVALCRRPFRDNLSSSGVDTSALQAITFHSYQFHQQSVPTHNYDGVLLLSSLGFSLIFTSFFSTQNTDVFVLLGIAIFLLFTERNSPLFSLFLSHEKLPFNVSVWGLIVAAFSLVLSFFYFSDGSFFFNHFPFWADRLLGAGLLFCFVLLFQQFSSQPFGLQVSLGSVALVFGICFACFQLSTYWLELAFVFMGLGCAVLYWVICFGPYKLNKGVTFSLGFFLGFLLLKLMTLGAVLPPLLLLFLGLSYLLYPYVRTEILKIHKTLFKN